MWGKGGLGSPSDPQQLPRSPRDNELVCPALSIALHAPEMPLGGDSCWPHNSHLKGKAGRSGSQEVLPCLLPGARSRGPWWF